MNKNYILVLCLLLITMFMPVLATTYYVNAIDGNDLNSGKSQNKALKTLESVSQLELKAGDKVMFAKGMVYKGSLIWSDLSGLPGNPIVVDSYTDTKARSQEAPVIDASGFQNGILLLNCKHIVIRNLTITANGGGTPDGKTRKTDMRCGVLISTTSKGEFGDITLSGLVIRDVFFEEESFTRGKDEVRTANGTQKYGWGIRVINKIEGALLKGIIVESCEVRNVAHTGIKFTAANRTIQDIKLYGNTVEETGGPGMQMSGVINGHVKNNSINRSGSSNDSRKWGRGSGLWTWSCQDILIENNSFRNAKGPGDSAGCHIDFNCSNVVVQYNLSENNAGGFCEILGNNYNCAYRYNVSINDGYRVKKVDGAFQEGKIFWLSGFVGKGRERNGPFNSYFYNNTIYVKSDIDAKFAVDRASEGALLVNNIFYIEGKSELVLGDQYKPEVAGESELKNIVFQNNLFLRADNWPGNMLIKDEAPLFGNPRFTNSGGKNIRDYIPLNRKLVKDKGIEITNIPGDDKGLYIGLDVNHDIMGNSIVGLPDMGAIEMK